MKIILIINKKHEFLTLKCYLTFSNLGFLKHTTHYSFDFVLILVKIINYLLFECYKFLVTPYLK